jgi:HSP20 family protein
MPHRITSPFGTVSLSPFEHDSILEQLFKPWHESHLETEPTALPVDIYEDDERFVVTADLPGIAKENIRVSLTEGMLTINAEVKPGEPKSGGHWLRRERHHGQYVRSIQLTGTYDAENIEASLNSGVLELVIPKPKKAQPKTISIKGG